jgi:hypothetical protein
MNEKENIDYVRGFKDALEWILAQANKGTVKELIDKASKLHTSVSIQHLANVQELFPSFSSLAMYYASAWPDDWEF